VNYRCPLTGEPLERAGELLVRADGAAYPIRDGFPVLMGPDIQNTEPPRKEGMYAEAYAEMGFYNAYSDELLTRIRAGPLTGSREEGIRGLDRLMHEHSRFPHENWLLSRMDVDAEWDGLQHIGSVTGQRVLQIGGCGVVALTLLMAGAERADLLTPMLAEARVARALAQKFGLSERLNCTIGIAEQLPFPPDSFDVIFSRGSVHHMETERVFGQFHRALRSGGRFAAVEPWRAPLYALGTRVLGKREPNPFCRPLTAQRVAPLFTAFADARCVQHGTLSRYAMLAIEKSGIRFPISMAQSIGRIDDAVSSLCGLRRFGSGVALLARK
jgi:SAM-dependent methyltransferase